MRKPLTTFLVTINALLLVAVVLVAFAPRATAQSRVRGQYMMVGGTAQGNNKGILYITDTATMEVVAVQWDDNQRSLNGIGYRNLGDDAGNVSRSQGR